MGAALIERMGIIWGVTVFLVTALAGTIISSKIEKCLRSMLFRVFIPFSIGNAGRAVTVPVSVRGACPRPGSNSDCEGCTISF
jgi:hypothetical protein